MSVKGKLIKKVATKIKKKIGSMNSTDNMSSKGPIDNAIKKGKPPKGATMEDMMPDINPNDYGFGTDGFYQARAKAGKLNKFQKSVKKMSDEWKKANDPF